MRSKRVLPMIKFWLFNIEGGTTGAKAAVGTGTEETGATPVVDAVWDRATGIDVIFCLA